MPDLSETIETRAAAPASMSTGSETVTEHNLKDLIEADKYLAEKAAATTSVPGFGLRTVRAKPPGAGPC